MLNETRIEELLLKWQEHYERGIDLPVPDLARDCPELAPVLERRINLVRQLNQFATSPSDDSVPCVATVEFGPVDASPPAGPAFAFLRPTSSASALGRLGSFEVLEKIGQGGMGWVFRAEDVVVKRQVALKVIKPTLAEDPNARERFLREARSAAAIEHENVIPIYQVGEDNGVVFIAMPLLKGQSLESRLIDSTPITPLLLVQIAEEMALGLAAAHERGVIHRDIKPANLWLEDRPNGDMRVKILDFGLARPLSYEGEAPTLFAAGTPGYISPEQLHAEPCDARTDLFAFGCVLYRLATRRPAFPGKSITATLGDPPLSPAIVDPAIPAALSELIMRMLAKRRTDRPTSATEVLNCLRGSDRETAIAQDATTQTLPSAVGTATAASSRSLVRTWGSAVAGVAVFLLLIATVVAWRANQSDNPQPIKPPPSDPPNVTPTPIAIRGQLEINVWKKGDPNQKRGLGDPKVLPLQAGDEVQINAKANRAAYFYLVQVESSGGIAPMYPWMDYDWERRKTEKTSDFLRIPDDPVLNAAALTESPTGVEAIYLFVRETPLSAQDQVTLRRHFDALPMPEKQDLFRGAVFLSERDTPFFTQDEDRGRLALPNDALNRFRALLQGDVQRLFADTRIVCYSFKSAK